MQTIEQQPSQAPQPQLESKGIPINPEAFRGITEAMELKFGRQILQLTQSQLTEPISGDLSREAVYAANHIRDKELEKMPESQKELQTALDRMTAKIHSDFVGASELELNPEETDALVKDSMEALEVHISIMGHTKEATEKAKGTLSKDTEETTSQTNGQSAEPGSSSPETAMSTQIEKVRGSRLPGMDDVGIVKILEKAGFTRIRQSGSHAIYKNPDGHVVPVPVGHGDIKTGTRDSIFNQAGISDPTKFM